MPRLSRTSLKVCSYRTYVAYNKRGRGWRQSSSFNYIYSIGKLVNADHNGALNIMRKVVGDSYISRIVNSGHSLCLVRYSNPFFQVV